MGGSVLWECDEIEEAGVIQESPGVLMNDKRGANGGSYEIRRGELMAQA